MEDDENAHLKDWDLVLKRACDVIDEVTEKQPHKTLHIYSQPDFVTTLGERTMFSIAGCTDDSTMFEATKDMKQYQDSVQMVDFTQPLPFRCGQSRLTSQDSFLISLSVESLTHCMYYAVLQIPVPPACDLLMPP